MKKRVRIGANLSKDVIVAGGTKTTRKPVERRPNDTTKTGARVYQSFRVAVLCQYFLGPHVLSTHELQYIEV